MESELNYKGGCGILRTKILVQNLSRYHFSTWAT